MRIQNSFYKKPQLYVIDWYVNGKIKETINLNNPVNRFITKSTIKTLSKTTHKTGKLLARGIN